ncbi:uroporphyrinogen-III synthase [Zeaxanthinibacter enoshimensis]|uniref:uroporphyrinogen-III synthase n=1 Tax=Zeaxanthinibacter enoshimensis TaxID=392009 RepID=UPI0035653231
MIYPKLPKAMTAKTGSETELSRQETTAGDDPLQKPLSAADSQGKKSSILSTKKLSTPQKTPLLAAGYRVEDYDAITTIAVAFETDGKGDHYIFTSQNGVEHFLKRKTATGEASGKSTFCVGDKTRILLEQHGFKVQKSAENASELAEFLVKNYKNDSFLFFCGIRRMPTLRQIFDENGMDLREVEVYDTVLQSKSFPQSFGAVLFFSPSGVESFSRENDLHNTFAYCIGPTTARAARLYTNHICIAEEPTIEATVQAVLDNPPAFTE